MKSKRNSLVGVITLLLVLGGAATTVAETATHLHQPATNRLLPMMAPGIPTASMKPDQVNTKGWDTAWTNLVNDAEQTFLPAMPRLMGVEVELVVGNGGATEDDLTLTVLDEAGQTVAVVTKTVRTVDDDHVLFAIPKNGIEITLGRIYRLKLTGGITFGWKYIAGGYSKGEALCNGKPLLPGARSTFLFRTFGAE